MPAPARSLRSTMLAALPPVALALWLVGAHAEPLRAPRPQPRPSGFAALPFAAERNAFQDRACGTRLDDLPATVETLIARRTLEPAATTWSGDIGEIAVLENDGTFFFTNSGNQPLLDIAAVARAFYRDHPDDYDQIAIYLASGTSQWLGSPGALAAAWMVRNSTDGIGLDRFDYGAALGLPPRLSSVLTMNGLHRYPADVDAPIGGPTDTFSTMDVLAHEFGHEWLSYVLVDSLGTQSPALLGRDLQHWGFFADVDGSFMEGCGWTEVAPDSFRTTSVSDRFGVLDQYLMGLRTRAEIDSLFVVNAPTDFNPPGIYIPITTPFVGLGCRGRATGWRVSDIEAVHGPRVPDGAVAPRAFRVGFILVTPRGVAATPADLAEVENIRQRFPLTIAASTDGRASVDVSLDASPTTFDWRHTPLPDLESDSAPRALGVGVHLLRPSTLTPAVQVALHWRALPAGGFSPVPLTWAGPDSFTAQVPTLPSGGDAEYYFTASEDSSGASGTWPVAGSSAPFRYHIGPDLTAPLIRHTPVPAQSRDRLPQTLLARVTDALGVDSVWCEYRVGAGAWQQSGAVRAGRDSFTVALGAGATLGTPIAYRFVARDRASASNLAVSSPTADTLRVIHDWIDDFENPTPFFHFNVLYSWRDPWHVEPGASSPNGEFAWHCGSSDGTPYAPHLDAALYSPLIGGIVAGTSVSFDHRYDLEALDASRAWDAARLEISVANGAYQSLATQAGYSHTMLSGSMPFARNSACWSGTALAWRTETVDLSAYAPNSVRLRWRMCADDLVGGSGWWVDRLRVHFPDNAVLTVPAPGRSLSLGPAWPNPAGRQLHQGLRLAVPSEVRWTLHDVQGRQVRELRRESMGAGAHELAGDLPAGLAGGVYFARLAVNGVVLTTQRVAVMR